MFEKKQMQLIVPGKQWPFLFGITTPAPVCPVQGWKKPNHPTPPPYCGIIPAAEYYENYPLHKLISTPPGFKAIGHLQLGILRLVREAKRWTEN